MRNFVFIYPFAAKGTSVELTVSGYTESRHGKPVIKKVHFREEPVSYDLLYFINRELFDELQAAAENHVNYKPHLTTHRQLSQSEQELLSVILQKP